MKESLINIPVALVFFNRPEPLNIVFNEIKKIRPSKLFLIQDGARYGNSLDKEKIMKCRQIVSSIDWECEVYTNYSEDNLGCGMRIYSGISWCFEYVDRLCIIEDDCKPSKDFFRFCEELLEKYKNDTRIDMISGMNNLDTYDRTNDSYIFSKTGSIWGWATWKRAWDTVEYDLNFMNDPLTVELLKKNIFPKRLRSKLIKDGYRKYEKLNQGEKLTSWSFQRGINMYLQSGLIIVPKKNLISNIGLTDDSVHSVNSIKKMPRSLQRLYFMQTYEIEFPLKHPKYIIEDHYFNEKMHKLMHPNFIISNSRRLESIIRRIIYK